MKLQAKVFYGILIVCLLQILGFVVFAVLPWMISAKSTLAVFMAFPVAILSTFVILNFVKVCIDKIKTKPADNQNTGETN